MIVIISEEKLQLPVSRPIVGRVAYLQMRYRVSIEVHIYECSHALQSTVSIQFQIHSLNPGKKQKTCIGKQAESESHANCPIRLSPPVRRHPRTALHSRLCSQNFASSLCWFLLSFLSPRQCRERPPQGVKSTTTGKMKYVLVSGGESCLKFCKEICGLSHWISSTRQEEKTLRTAATWNFAAGCTE